MWNKATELQLSFHHFCHLHFDVELLGNHATLITTRDMSFSHQGDRLLKVQNWSLVVYWYQHYLVASWWL